MILDYNQFMILESFSNLNESAGGFASIKDMDSAEKAAEKYKKQLDDAKNKMKDISPSKVISYCYGKLKAGEGNSIKKEMPFIDEVRAALDYAAVGMWTASEYESIAKKYASMNAEEDSKDKAKLKKEIDEMNNEAAENFNKSSARMIQLAYYTATQSNDAEKYKQTLKAYCQSNKVDLNIDSLCE